MQRADMKENTETRMIHERGWAMAIFRHLPELPHSQNGEAVRWGLGRPLDIGLDHP